MIKKYTPTCDCGSREDFEIVLHNKIAVGITTQFLPNGVFKNNQSFTLENNFCPQCGAKRIVELIGRED